ncbi:Uncharacterised protein [Mycobacteroides abscessus subsp. abscessus]|nr:Uncharacterised protein [Mycobacteroides abscessus subsp. abscessus]
MVSTVDTQQVILGAASLIPRLGEGLATGLPDTLRNTGFGCCDHRAVLLSALDGVGQLGLNLIRRILRGQDAAELVDGRFALRGVGVQLGRGHRARVRWSGRLVQWALGLGNTHHAEIPSEATQLARINRGLVARRGRTQHGRVRVRRRRGRRLSAGRVGGLGVHLLVVDGGGVRVRSARRGVLDSFVDIECACRTVDFVVNLAHSAFTKGLDLLHPLIPFATALLQFLGSGLNGFGVLVRHLLAHALGRGVGHLQVLIDRDAFPLTGVVDDVLRVGQVGHNRVVDDRPSIAFQLLADVRQPG